MAYARRLTRPSSCRSGLSRALQTAQRARQSSPQLTAGVMQSALTVPDDRSELMGMITAVLSGELRVAEFEEHFLAYYHSDVPLDLSFNDREEALFSAIAERFEYSVVHPDQEARDVGYISHSEALNWLTHQMERFKRGESAFRAFDPA